MKIRKAKNRKLVREALKFQPFDFGYVLELERQSFKYMAEYFKTAEIAVSDEITYRDLKIVVKLLDIIMEDDCAYQHDGDGKGHLTTYINIKNAHRFGFDNMDEQQLKTPVIQSYLREAKAWYIYNKLRLNKMQTWWN